MGFIFIVVVRACNVILFICFYFLLIWEVKIMKLKRELGKMVYKNMGFYFVGKV